MITPKYIKNGSVIGVTATSAGAGDTDRVRYMNGAKNLSELGIKTVFTDNVFLTGDNGRSSDAQTRAKQFMELITDKNIDAVVLARGGDYLCEMLPYTDSKKIIDNPKWVQGYSDSTWMTHYLTTVLDIKSIYGCGFGDFGQSVMHKSIMDNINILKGSKAEQNSFDYYEEKRIDRVTGIEEYGNDGTVVWKNYHNKNTVNISGRMIGGCLDVLLLTEGTPYDGTLNFLRKYSEDGIIWYLESFNASDEITFCSLWKLRECGWFQKSTGFIFGRPFFGNKDYYGAVTDAIGNMDIPIIFDADIGHKPPRMTIINGAKANIMSSVGKGKMIIK